MLTSSLHKAGKLQGKYTSIFWMQGKRYLTVYQKEILERVFTEVCPFITKTGKEKEEE